MPNFERFSNFELPKKVEKIFKNVLNEHVGKNGEFDIENGYIIIDDTRAAITYEFKGNIYSVLFQKNIIKNRWEIKNKPTKWIGMKELTVLGSL